MTATAAPLLLAATTWPHWLGAWLAAFVATQIFELPIHALGLAWGWRAPPPTGKGEAPASPPYGSLWPPARAWALALVPSSLTHPIVWFVFPRLLPEDWHTMVVAAETFAVLGEAVLLRLLAPRLGLAGALAVSVVANGASLGLGLWLRAMTGWV
jgi:hypothetical protein